MESPERCSCFRGVRRNSLHVRPKGHVTAVRDVGPGVDLVTRRDHKLGQRPGQGNRPRYVLHRSNQMGNARHPRHDGARAEMHNRVHALSEDDRSIAGDTQFARHGQSRLVPRGNRIQKFSSTGIAVIRVGPTLRSAAGAS